jgi:CP2 transcription factor
MDPTPRANTVDQFRFTPSLLDPNSFAFSSFANQPPGYYTPTPGGTNTIYHPQAGDLHTPGFSMGLGTPLSMPTSEAGISGSQASTGNLHGFNPQALAPHIFQNPNPFAFQHQPHQQHHDIQHQHPETFAPHQFSHHPTAFEPFQQHHVEEAKIQEYPVDVEMQEQSAMETFGQSSMDLPIGQSAPSLPLERYVLNSSHDKSYHETRIMAVDSDQLNSFRFHVKLNAPTAMIKHPEEIPVTYLNKGQAYTISIVDTKPPNQGVYGTTLPTYRTFIRISFEDDEQRQKPSQCWQLWKEGRGTNEAHHRGGRLQAVEFVNSSQTGSLDTSAPQISIESESFDGFSVKWTPNPHAPAECSLSVRFNFLSTDFSHSKGVKGIPVRLCAKTQMLSSEIPVTPSIMNQEICYCKVKLFRDHGAERKLTNDVAHVKKSIDKLKQQITQIESGMKDFSKRKRSESGSKPGSSSRPGKVQKHKRTWSMSSASDTGPKSSQEDDLQLKLAALQDMFTSTRPLSILFLKGEEPDDPDLHPVLLSTDTTTATLQRTDTGESASWERQSGPTSSIVSPTPSQQSLHSQDRADSSSSFQRPTPFQGPSRLGSNEWQPQTATADLHPPGPQFSTADIPVKIQKMSTAPGSLPEWIDAVGVDFAYHPPPERVVKPG